MKPAAKQAPQGHSLGSERARIRMVDALRAQGVRDEAVLAAMEQVPRHAFIDPGLAHRAYDDVSLPIGQEQTISKPSTVARMIELLAARVPRDKRAAAKVLEVGTGCGYQAVVLARVFGEVVSIERVRWLHEAARTNLRPMRLPNVRLVFGDGADGVAVAAPFDGIVMAAAAHRIPDNLLLQMKVGSRLVAPVVSEDGRQQSLHVVDRAGHNDWSLTVLDAVRFVPLRAGTR